MKKGISILLTLMMIISLIMPTSYAAEETAYAKFFQQFSNKYSNKLSTQNKVELATIMLELDKQNIADKIFTDNSLKARLEGYGITKSMISNTISNLKTKLDYKDLPALLNNSDKLVSLVKDSVDNDLRIALFKLVKGSNDEKASTGMKIVDYMINDLSLTISNGNLSVGGVNTFSQHLDSLSGNFNKALPEKSEIESLFTITAKQLTGNNITYAKNVLDALKGSNNNNNNNNNNNSGSGGGSGSTTGSTTTNTENGKVEITVPKDAVDVKKDGDTTTATIKKDELTKAVKEVLDKASTSNEIVVNIEIKDIKDLNAKVSIPVESLRKLEGKEALIVIKTNKLEVSIPIKSLDLGNEKSYIELNIKEFSKEEAKNIVKGEINNVAKIIQLNLVKVEGDTRTNIDSSFAKKVSVGIDVSDTNVNKEKAVVVFVKDDGTTQIVGGKVKGSKIYANLEHFSKYAVVERDITFDDIQSHWSKQYVESMASKNIANGYKDNTFKPENKVTRAEFAKLLTQALELDITNNGSNFTDMNGHWANDYVNAAYKSGIIKGTDGKFNPDANITRAEMATMIGRSLKGSKNTDLNKFYDSNMIPSWAKDSVSKAVAEELIKGDNGNFRPNDNTTRSEATTVIYRLFNK